MSNLNTIRRLREISEAENPLPAAAPLTEAGDIFATPVALFEEVLPGMKDKYTESTPEGFVFTFDENGVYGQCTLRENNTLNFTGSNLSSFLREKNFVQGVELNLSESRYLFHTLKEWVQRQWSSTPKVRVVETLGPIKVESNKNIIQKLHEKDDAFQREIQGDFHANGDVNEAAGSAAVVERFKSKFKKWMDAQEGDHDKLEVTAQDETITIKVTPGIAGSKVTMESASIKEVQRILKHEKGTGNLLSWSGKGGTHTIVAPLVSNESVETQVDNEEVVQPIEEVEALAPSKAYGCLVDCFKKSGLEFEQNKTNNSTQFTFKNIASLPREITKKIAEYAAARGTTYKVKPTVDENDEPIIKVSVLSSNNESLDEARVSPIDGISAMVWIKKAHKEGKWEKWDPSSYDSSMGIKGTLYAAEAKDGSMVFWDDHAYGNDYWVEDEYGEKTWTVKTTGEELNNESVEPLDEAEKVRRIRDGSIALVRNPLAAKLRKALSPAQKAALRKASRAAAKPGAIAKRSKSLRKGHRLGLYEGGLNESSDSFQSSDDALNKLFSTIEKRTDEVYFEEFGDKMMMFVFSSSVSDEKDFPADLRQALDTLEKDYKADVEIEEINNGESEFFEWTIAFPFKGQVFNESLEALEEAKKRRGRPPKMVTRIRNGLAVKVYDPSSKRKVQRLLTSAQKAAQRKASMAGNRPEARKKAAKSLSMGRRVGLYESKRPFNMDDHDALSAFRQHLRSLGYNPRGEVEIDELSGIERWTITVPDFTSEDVTPAIEKMVRNIERDMDNWDESDTEFNNGEAVFVFLSWEEESDLDESFLAEGHPLNEDALNSRNLSHGYYGELIRSRGLETSEVRKAFTAMLDLIQKATGTPKSGMTRDYLDSARGRHLADAEERLGVNSPQFAVYLKKDYNRFARSYDPSLFESAPVNEASDVWYNDIEPTFDRLLELLEKDHRVDVVMAPGQPGWEDGYSISFVVEGITTTAGLPRLIKAQLDKLDRLIGVQYDSEIVQGDLVISWDKSIKESALMNESPLRLLDANRALINVDGLKLLDLTYIGKCFKKDFPSARVELESEGEDDSEVLEIAVRLDGVTNALIIDSSDEVGFYFKGAKFQALAKGCNPTIKNEDFVEPHIAAKFLEQFIESLAGVLTESAPTNEANLSSALNKLPKWSGKAYRGSEVVRYKGSAADLIKYERDELGNSDDISDEIMFHLEKVPASHVIWVCKTPEDAENYGDPEEVDIPSGSRILIDDGDGGYLVLFPSKANESVSFIPEGLDTGEMLAEIWKTKEDAEKHYKGLTDHEAEIWLAAANKSHAWKKKEGGSPEECDEYAMRVANAAVNKSRGIDSKSELED